MVGRVARDARSDPLRLRAAALGVAGDAVAAIAKELRTAYEPGRAAPLVGVDAAAACTGLSRRAVLACATVWEVGRRVGHEILFREDDLDRLLARPW